MIDPSDLRQRHIVNPPIAAIPTRLSAKRHCNRLMAFPRNPADKAVVDGWNPGIVMRTAERLYFYIQDTCQIHPILFVINDGHGIFIQTYFRIGMNCNNNPKIDGLSRPGHLPTGPATCWPYFLPSRRQETRC